MHRTGRFRSQDIQFFNMVFWSYWKNGLVNKDKVNFKIPDVTIWLANNYKTHITQYFTK